MSQLARAVRPLLIACAFLTRLPVSPRDVQETELGRAAACFPLVGFALGALSFGTYWLAAPRLGPQLTAALVLALGAGVTGALHLDGLADWFDAAGARGDRTRLLEIMRDPRIGAHGASALVLLLMTKAIAIAQLPQPKLGMALLCAPACGRCCVVLLACLYPNARADGLGKSFEQHVRSPHALLAGSFTCAGLFWFGTIALLPALLSVATAALLAFWANARLSGLTGDVYGAAIELAELAFLVACAVR